MDEGDCPLGDSPEAAADGLRELVARIDEDPLPLADDPHVDRLTVGWATYGLAAAMYSEDSWPALRQALALAQDGQGRGLMTLANSYADRTASGQYASNLMEAFNTYTCNDRVGDSQGRSDEEIRAASRRRHRCGVSSCWARCPSARTGRSSPPPRSRRWRPGASPSW
ncbi:hypothetical protein BJF82_05620 [Kytococcus sp. CUA-901]|nr:hypothetical protein BJF82_05620 [Kytococcus sp. CUA-901]